MHDRTPRHAAILDGAPSRRRMMAMTAALALVPALPARAAEKLRFAVGPFQPTPGDTRKAYEPFFQHLARALGVDYDLVVTTDWAGISIALANGQADVAWMGPWGYVLARNEGGSEAIATVKYDGEPFYHAIIVKRPGLAIPKWPDDARGMSISFADVGSTSGWLIPTYYFLERGIDPKTFFRYREGSSHPANEIAVANGQVDLATDYDRNYNLMIERGLIRRDAVEIAWTSDPLPNDPLVVRKGLDPVLTKRIIEVVQAVGDAEAAIMPPHYTGWVPASHADYTLIEKAGIAVGKIKPRQ